MADLADIAQHLAEEIAPAVAIVEAAAPVDEEQSSSSDTSDGDEDQTSDVSNENGDEKEDDDAEEEEEDPEHAAAVAEIRARCDANLAEEEGSGIASAEEAATKNEITMSKLPVVEKIDITLEVRRSFVVSVVAVFG